METDRLLTRTTTLLFLLFAVIIGGPTATVFASTSLEEEEEEAAEEEETPTTPETLPGTTLGTTVPPQPPETTITIPPTGAPAPTAAGAGAGAPATDDFVRAKVVLLGIQPNSSDIVTWITVPGTANATSTDTISAAALEATNNQTSDGVGEMFMNMRNIPAVVNQQIEACALDTANRQITCDDAFQTATNATTILQILVGQPPV